MDAGSFKGVRGFGGTESVRDLLRAPFAPTTTFASPSSLGRFRSWDEGGGGSSGRVIRGLMVLDERVITIAGD
jgi:hypothetical protein